MGDSIPAVTLYEGSPGNEVKLQDVFKGKKGILFGVPGAFTPGCSKTHLPGYINDYEKLKAAGAEVVVCTAGAFRSSKDLAQRRPGPGGRRVFVEHAQSAAVSIEDRKSVV